MEEDRYGHGLPVGGRSTYHFQVAGLRPVPASQVAPNTQHTPSPQIVSLAAAGLWRKQYELIRIRMLMAPLMDSPARIFFWP